MVINYDNIKNAIENILENPVGYHVCKPIKLTDWEQELFNQLNENINKIIIITDRKVGSTYFCKLLHYFKPTGRTFVISNNLYWSNAIKRNMIVRIKKEVIGKVNPNYDWMEPISKNKFLKEDFKTNYIIEEEIGKLLNINLFDDHEFMVDNCYDIRVLDKINKLNPTLFTLSISKPLNSDFWDKEKNKEFFNWVEEMKKRKDTCVILDESINYTQLQNCFVKN